MHGGVGFGYTVINGAHKGKANGKGKEDDPP